MGHDLTSCWMCQLGCSEGNELRGLRVDTGRVGEEDRSAGERWQWRKLRKLGKTDTEHDTVRQKRRERQSGRMF